MSASNQTSLFVQVMTRVEVLDQLNACEQQGILFLQHNPPIIHIQAILGLYMPFPENSERANWKITRYDNRRQLEIQEVSHSDRSQDLPPELVDQFIKKVLQHCNTVLQNALAQAEDQLIQLDDELRSRQTFDEPLGEIRDQRNSLQAIVNQGQALLV